MTNFLQGIAVAGRLDTALVRISLARRTFRPINVRFLNRPTAVDWYSRTRDIGAGESATHFWLDDQLKIRER